MPRSVARRLTEFVALGRRLTKLVRGLAGAPQVVDVPGEVGRVRVISARKAGAAYLNAACRDRQLLAEAV